MKFESHPTTVVCLMGKWVAATGYSYAVYTFNNELRAVIDVNDGTNSDNVLLSKAWTPSLATWYTVRASFYLSAGTGKLFIDGVDQSATVTDTTPNVSIPYAINNSTSPFMVGAFEAGPAYFLDGVIDAVVVAETYTATHSEPLNVTPGTDYLEDMKGLWNFNSSSYDDEIESSDLTAPNGATFVDGYPFQL